MNLQNSSILNLLSHPFEVPFVFVVQRKAERPLKILRAKFLRAIQNSSAIGAGSTPLPA